MLVVKYVGHMTVGIIAPRLRRSRQDRSLGSPKWELAKDYRTSTEKFLAKSESCIQISQKGIKIHCVKDIFMRFEKSNENNIHLLPKNERAKTEFCGDK